jgi:hypothetical protein
MPKIPLTSTASDASSTPCHRSIAVSYSDFWASASGSWPDSPRSGFTRPAGLTAYTSAGGAFPLCAHLCREHVPGFGADAYHGCGFSGCRPPAASLRNSSAWQAPCGIGRHGADPERRAQEPGTWGNSSCPGERIRREKVSCYSTFQPPFIGQRTRVAAERPGTSGKRTGKR